MRILALLSFAIGDSGSCPIHRLQNRWHSAEIGPTVGPTYTGAGRAAAALAVDGLQGYGYNQRYQPLTTAASFDGSDQKGAIRLTGGVGWYTILKQNSELASTTILNGRIRLPVGDVALWGAWEFDIASDVRNLINIRTAKNVGNIVDQTRLSSDGSGNVNLDLHVASTNNPVILKYEFTGVGDIVDTEQECARRSPPERLPPRGFGSLEPSSRQRRTHLIAELKLTSKRSADSRRDAPASTVPITRSPRSQTIYDIESDIETTIPLLTQLAQLEGGFCNFS
jgi:hypothetical protein